MLQASQKLSFIADLLILIVQDAVAGKLPVFIIISVDFLVPMVEKIFFPFPNRFAIAEHAPELRVTIVEIESGRIALAVWEVKIKSPGIP